MCECVCDVCTHVCGCRKERYEIKGLECGRKWEREDVKIEREWGRVNIICDKDRW